VELVTEVQRCGQTTNRNVWRMDDGHVLEEEATRAWLELQLQVQNRDDGVLGQTLVGDEDMLAR
jgi:hypothetical protein